MPSILRLAFLDSFDYPATKAHYLLLVSRLLQSAMPSLKPSSYSHEPVALQLSRQQLDLDLGSFAYDRLNGLMAFPVKLQPFFVKLSSCP